MHLLRSTAFSAAILVAATTHAGDLDDGISKYNDDPISKWDEIGDRMVNEKYTVLKARAKANQAKKRDGCRKLEGYSNVTNSIVITDPAVANNLRDVYNIHDSSGNSSAIGCIE
ncbi:hypothetical protein [Endothiovibrio diazotrophicus]